ncbi:branched-chain amino acid ABC transporter ATP-binding protein/permease [Streptomyces cadmiisoli]|uniref:branched-chain amino acid ABC transporter ATP-binding protein/permease n=1 Tax=Streptomyces cadmiisoli TaxID=2184053 RepID=UPI003658C986
MLTWLGSYHYLGSTAIIMCLLGYSTYVLLRTGIFAVPQIAYFCIGAYLSTILTVDHEVNFYVAIATGGLAAAACGATLGWLLRSVSGIYLAIATIAFGEVTRVIVRNLDVTGGPSGILGIPRAAQDWHLVLTLAVVIIACAVLAKSRYGVAMDALRQDQLVAEHLGIAARLMRIQLFALSGLIAGIAGGLFAHFRGFIIPNDFALPVLLSVLALVVVGGLYGFTGPLVGAVVVHTLPELFADLEEYREIMLGAMLAIIILFAPRGVSGLVESLVAEVRGRQRRARSAAVASAIHEPAAAETPSGDPRRARDDVRVPSQQVEPGPALAVRDVTKRFGGLAALSNVSFDIRKGEFLGLIGPNGSGKSTLINVVSGALEPTSGTLEAHGRRLSLGRPEKTADERIGRTFQGIRLFTDFTAIENVALGAYCRHQRWTGSGGAGYFAIWRREAAEVLELVRVPASMWSRDVTTLPYGIQRRIEIARALMGHPHLLMLDEPTAGMAEDETQEIFALVSEVARERDISVLAVEHDVPVMRTYCDRVVVLNFGQLIADGSPEVVLRDRTVVEAYLGQS